MFHLLYSLNLQFLRKCYETFYKTFIILLAKLQINKNFLRYSSFPLEMLYEVLETFDYIHVDKNTCSKSALKILEQHPWRLP